MKLNKRFLVIVLLVCFSTLHFAENNPKGSDRILNQTSYENSSQLLMQYHFASYARLAGEFSDEQDKNDTGEEKVSRKSPWLAFFLSFFLPTSGQIYNGDYTKALIQAGLMLGGGGLVTTMACVECGDYGTAQTGLLIAGAAMLFSGYIWSIIDAPTSANNINDKLNYKNINQVMNNRSEIIGKNQNLFFSSDNLISIKIKF